MVELATYRMMGYIFANVCIVLSVLEAAKCLTKIGNGYDLVPSVELLLAILCIVFSLVLIIGIKRANVSCVKSNRAFLIFLNTIAIIFTVMEYIYTMLVYRRIDKGWITLIIAVVLFIVIFLLELWILNGVLRYVESKQKVEIATIVTEDTLTV
ncbi:uncharacterized protein LOC131689143 [Topomyia yanbarensis]|uniref:uncharacterized protein LOC131689143 n=1 Tax=Topomyia yanbarensis TaxID=2498891 RepID=UPI00273CBD1E|nr:uncharacterized protein LOC131689143 [Topomyia yanbarensis]